jgi:threonine dehydrogenase-like Zn-dependent dehydrogenase
MRATIMYGKKDVRVENVPDATIVDPSDAVVRVTRACICGSDLWPYNLMEATSRGQSMGHEAIGTVEAIGADVQTLKVGDLVIMPFAHSDGSCPFCHEGLQTACVHVGFSAMAASTVRRPKRCASLMPTGRCSRSMLARTMR